MGAKELILEYFEQGVVLFEQNKGKIKMLIKFDKALKEHTGSGVVDHVKNSRKKSKAEELKNQALLDKVQDSFLSNIANKYSTGELDPHVSRAFASMLRQHVKQEKNKSEILDHFFEILLEDLNSTTNSEPEDNNFDKEPDEEILEYIFSNMGDASSEDLQRLWAKILYGELKEPRNCSKRTLMFIKTLNRAEAELIEKLSFVTLSDTNNTFIPLLDNGRSLDSLGVTFNDLLILKELGVINNETFVYKPHKSTSEQQILALIYGDHILTINYTLKTNHNFELNILSLTNLGKDLIKFLMPTVDKNFIYSLGNMLSKRYSDISIITSKIISKEDGFNLKLDPTTQITYTWVPFGEPGNFVVAEVGKQAAHVNLSNMSSNLNI